jgi:hypothetical protein
MLKVSWKREELNSFNIVETCTIGICGSFFLAASRRVQNTCVLGE